MTKLQAFLKRLSEKNNALGAISVLFYRLFASAIVQTVTNFVLTLLIGKFIFTVDYNINWGFLIPAGTSYLLLNIIFLAVNNYYKKSAFMQKLTANCLKEVTAVSYTIKESISEVRKVYESSQNSDYFIKFNLFYTGAVSVCESIYYLLSGVFSNQRFKVSIFRQFDRPDGNRYIKMIAYKSYENRRPKCVDKEITLYAKDSTKLYITKIFESNNQDVVCLNKKEQIHDLFEKINGEKINTKQYIAIPCQAEGDYISFVIQISSYDEKMFKNIDIMKELGEEILVSYREILALINEQKLFCDNIMINERKAVPRDVSIQTSEYKESGRGKTFEPV